MLPLLTTSRNATWRTRSSQKKCQSGGKVSLRKINVREKNKCLIFHAHQLTESIPCMDIMCVLNFNRCPQGPKSRSSSSARRACVTSSTTTTTEKRRLCTAFTACTPAQMWNSLRLCCSTMTTRQHGSSASRPGRMLASSVLEVESLKRCFVLVPKGDVFHCLKGTLHEPQNPNECCY